MVPRLVTLSAARGAFLAVAPAALVILLGGCYAGVAGLVLGGITLSKGVTRSGPPSLAVVQQLIVTVPRTPDEIQIEFLVAGKNAEVQIDIEIVNEASL